MVLDQPATKKGYEKQVTEPHETCDSLEKEVKGKATRLCKLTEKTCMQPCCIIC